MNLKAIILSILIIVAVGILLQQEAVQKPVLNFLDRNIPWSIPAFTFVKDNIASGSLIGVVLFLLFANIPLLPSPPAEAYIVFAFVKGTNIFGILFVSVLFYVLVSLVYYFIARFWGQKILDKLLKRHVGHSEFLDKFIGPIIFFSHLLPLPFPISLPTITILLAGTYKAKLSQVIVAVGMGTLFRILIILAIYQFNKPLIEHYWSSLGLLKLG